MFQFFYNEKEGKHCIYIDTCFEIQIVYNNTKTGDGTVLCNYNWTVAYTS